MSVEAVNQLLGLGTFALQIVTIALLLAYLLRRSSPLFSQVIVPIGAWAPWVGFIVSFGASALTLFYSDVLGIPPCPLCWWQRVFLYPQVILFALALWRKENVAHYSIALSVLGVGVALYHHALQVFPAGTLPCPAQGVSCAQLILFEMGYITFPLMAVTLFAFLILVMLIGRSAQSA